MSRPPQFARRGSEPDGWTSSWPGWLFIGLLGLLVGARVAEAWHLPLPLCWFKVVTGLPCAFCGGTRALFAVARRDFATAARLNPLVCLLAAAAVAAFLAWAADRWLGTHWGTRLRGWSDWPWLWIGLAGLLVNWFYLLAVAEGW